MQFRIAARTDAAGKYSPEAPLEGNEDNMFIDNDLSNEQQGAFVADEVVNLSDKGCLMVVADGMGGMNAGEVASDIAIKTVMAYFSHDKLTDEVVKDTRSRIKYMEEVLVAADAAVKKDAKNNPEHEGMGSTIILAWLCDGEICLTWCGDSRAYLFRPAEGLKQVSKDHSYVQGLVDEGKITEIQAFDHPYGNVITRSLGDPDKKAHPDSVSFKVYEGDIFMLCSDGLSGVVRDRKTFVDGQRIDVENLEDIISENRASMEQCRDALFEAAERNDWYDNVTVVLCEIMGGEACVKDGDVVLADVSKVAEANQSKSHITIKKNKLALIIGAVAVLLCTCFFLLWKYVLPDGPERPESDSEVAMPQIDSLGMAVDSIGMMGDTPHNVQKDEGQVEKDQQGLNSETRTASKNGAEVSKKATESKEIKPGANEEPPKDTAANGLTLVREGSRDSTRLTKVIPDSLQTDKPGDTVSSDTNKAVTD